MAEKDYIDIEDFFTDDNEKNGVWHEPIIDGIPCGLSFLLIGIHSDEAVAKMEHYDRLTKELREKERDPELRAAKEKEIDAERVASLTKGMKTASGKAVRKDGKEIEFSTNLVKELYMHAPLIKMDCIEFAIKTANFMNRKKNL
jgi:hypothetical protein